ncbi:MAG: 50S ribosomal protein L25 [Treponema sp.]|jgi:large subunit ribosomal protein L25|nr:50S ribosomal protein L25 [Treponema sp.]
MANVILMAKKRMNKGSADARRLRRGGRIPAVIYGRNGQTLSIDIDAQQFSTSAKNISATSIVQVEVDGKSYDAFVKDTQRTITDDCILHVDFYEVEKGVLLRTKVHIHVHGNPIGVREGGVLELPLHEVEVECLPKDLPERITVDISGLQVNQSIHIKDIPIGDNVRLVSSEDQVVALVKFAKEEATSVMADEMAVAEVTSAEASNKK